MDEPSYGSWISPTDTNEYKEWCEMMYRCYNPIHPFYYLHGGKGVKVCFNWHSYDNFYDEMSPISDGTQLGRIDNEKGYYKENCEWVVPKEEPKEHDYNSFLVYNGKAQLLINWAQDFSIPYCILQNRINKKKWPMKKALTKPITKAENDNVRFEIDEESS